MRDRRFSFGWWFGKPAYKRTVAMVGSHPCDDMPYLIGPHSLRVCFPPIGFSVEWSPNLRYETRPAVLAVIADE